MKIFIKGTVQREGGGGAAKRQGREGRSRGGLGNPRQRSPKGEFFFSKTRIEKLTE